MFALPTASSPSDTGVSSVRVDEFAPVSTVNPAGGGTVAFECTSPANSFWCPRLSYFLFRLKVTERDVNGNEVALSEVDGTSGMSGSVQFRSYPAAACVQSFSHSINGVTVESITGVQETAAFSNRTGVSYEYARSAGNSLYRLPGANGARNTVSSSVPGGAIQALGNDRTVFDCAFISPSGVSRCRARFRVVVIDSFLHSIATCRSDVWQCSRVGLQRRRPRLIFSTVRSRRCAFICVT